MMYIPSLRQDSFLQLISIRRNFERYRRCRARRFVSNVGVHQFILGFRDVWSGARITGGTLIDMVQDDPLVSWRHLRLSSFGRYFLQGGRRGQV